jgi:hypothetical protein
LQRRLLSVACSEHLQIVLDSCPPFNAQEFVVASASANANRGDWVRQTDWDRIVSRIHPTIEGGGYATVVQDTPARLCYSLYANFYPAP